MKKHSNDDIGDDKFFPILNIFLEISIPPSINSCPQQHPFPKQPQKQRQRQKRKLNGDKKFDDDVGYSNVVVLSCGSVQRAKWEQCESNIQRVQCSRDQLGFECGECFLCNMGCQSALGVAQPIWMDCLLWPCWPPRPRFLWPMPTGTDSFEYNNMRGINLNL